MLCFDDFSFCPNDLENHSKGKLFKVSKREFKEGSWKVGAHCWCYNRNSIRIEGGIKFRSFSDCKDRQKSSSPGFATSDIKKQEKQKECVRYWSGYIEREVLLEDGITMSGIQFSRQKGFSLAQQADIQFG